MDQKVKGLELKYFVLKPKGNDNYAKASRAAMVLYAQMIWETNEKLADELHAWAFRERDAMRRSK